MASYDGVPIPAGWERVRQGSVDQFDRVLANGSRWVDASDYDGQPVILFCCVIRESGEPKERAKRKRRKRVVQKELF